MYNDNLWQLDLFFLKSNTDNQSQLVNQKECNIDQINQQLQLQSKPENVIEENFN